MKNKKYYQYLVIGEDVIASVINLNKKQSTNYVLSVILFIFLAIS